MTTATGPVHRQGRLPESVDIVHRNRRVTTIPIPRRRTVDPTMDTSHAGWEQVPDHIVGDLPVRRELLGDTVAVTREPAGFAPAPPVDCSPSGTNPRRCRLRAVRVTDHDGSRWTITATTSLPARPHPIAVPSDWPAPPVVPADGTPVGDLDPARPVAGACMDQGWVTSLDDDLRCHRTDLNDWLTDPPLHTAAPADPVQSIVAQWRHHHPAAAVRFAGRWVWPDWLALAPDGTSSIGPPEAGLDCRHQLVGVPRGRVGHLAAVQSDVIAGKRQPGKNSTVLYRATIDRPTTTVCGKPADTRLGPIGDVCKPCLVRLPDDSPVSHGTNVIGPDGLRMLGPDGIPAMLLTLLAP